jgi:hypothetical protein
MKSKERTVCGQFIVTYQVKSCLTPYLTSSESCSTQDDSTATFWLPKYLKGYKLKAQPPLNTFLNKSMSL